MRVRIANKDITKTFKWKKFQSPLIEIKIRKTSGIILKKSFQARFKYFKENYKLLLLNEVNIFVCVKKLKDIFRIDRKLEF